MARELKIFSQRQTVKHPSIIVSLPVRVLEPGYVRGNVIPVQDEYMFTGKVINRKGEGYKLPHWCEEINPGDFAKAVKAAQPVEKEPVSSAPAPQAPAAKKEDLV